VNASNDDVKHKSKGMQETKAGENVTYQVEIFQFLYNKCVLQCGEKKSKKMGGKIESYYD
jgi:hypothetical protein